MGLRTRDDGAPARDDPLSPPHLEGPKKDTVRPASGFPCQGPVASGTQGPGNVDSGRVVSGGQNSTSILKGTPMGLAVQMLLLHASNIWAITLSSSCASARANEV